MIISVAETMFLLLFNAPNIKHKKLCELYNTYHSFAIFEQHLLHRLCLLILPDTQTNPPDGGNGGGQTGGGMMKSPPKGVNRDKLSKRMLEKSRPQSKNQRSANISVEGRRTKG